MARIASEKIVCWEALAWAVWVYVCVGVDRYRLPEVFRLCGISGCHLSGGCGFDGLVNERLGLYVSPAELMIVGDKEESERAVGLTEAGQMPVTAIPVFPSLLKSIACNDSEVSSLFKHAEKELEDVILI